MIKRTIFGAALVASALSAQASTFKFLGKDSGEYVQVSGVRNGMVFAGRLNFQDSDLGSIKTYCVDLLRGFGPGSSWQVTTQDSQSLSERLRLAGNIIANGAGSANTDAKAAGLQLAVWSVIYNGSNKLDLSSGAFKATASASALGYAQQYFGLRTKNGNTVYFRNTSECEGGGGEMATPEPASIAALAVGVTTLLRRRKKA